MSIQHVEVADLETALKLPKFRAAIPKDKLERLDNLVNTLTIAKKLCKIREIHIELGVKQNE